MRVARRLRAEGRWIGRARLPGRFGVLFDIVRASVAGHIGFPRR